jgi:hypothetical protein
MPAFEGVWLINSDGPHRVPNDPGVIAYMVGRGWEVTDLPAHLDSDDPEFIEALEKFQAEKVTAEAKSATKSKKEDK